MRLIRFVSDTEAYLINLDQIAAVYYNDETSSTTIFMNFGIAVSNAANYSEKRSSITFTRPYGKQVLEALLNKYSSKYSDVIDVVAIAGVTSDYIQKVKDLLK